MRKHSIIILLMALIALLAFFISGCGEDGGANGDNEVEVADDAAYLTWDPNEESDLAGYNVHYGTESGNYDAFIDVGLTDDEDAPAYLVEDLDDGTTYYFAVTAYDLSGNESDFSTEATKAIGGR